MTQTGSDTIWKPEVSFRTEVNWLEWIYENSELIQKSKLGQIKTGSTISKPEVVLSNLNFSSF